MIVAYILILFLSLGLHEMAHGWMAYKLGDPTAKHSGRLTLNPLAHIDLLGTIILPLILFLIPGALPFGWAKPVPINPNHFRNPKKDTMWVGLAGPAANLIVAFLFSLILKTVAAPYLANLLLWTIVINLVLAIFNFIPIPPLDGSKILAYFLPAKLSVRYLKVQMYGLIFIIILINFGFFQWFILPILRLVLILLGIKMEGLL
jgi:Zn-dependent protease